MDKFIITDDSSSDLVESNLFKRNISGIIDAAIIYVLTIAYAYNFPVDVLVDLFGPFSHLVFALLLLTLYRLVFILLFNRTIGMRICKIRLLNGDTLRLSFMEKLFAAFYILIHGVSYYEKGKQALIN